MIKILGILVSKSRVDAALELSLREETGHDHHEEATDSSEGDRQPERARRRNHVRNREGWIFRQKGNKR